MLHIIPKGIVYKVESFISLHNIKLLPKLRVKELDAWLANSSLQVPLQSLALSQVGGQALEGNENNKVNSAIRRHYLITKISKAILVEF